MKQRILTTCLGVIAAVLLCVTAVSAEPTESSVVIGGQSYTLAEAALLGSPYDTQALILQDWADGIPTEGTVDAFDEVSLISDNIAISGTLSGINILIKNNALVGGTITITGQIIALDTVTMLMLSDSTTIGINGTIDAGSVIIFNETTPPIDITLPDGTIGLITLTAPITISIPATIDITPDTLNLNSNGKWVTCDITLPQGYYNVADIDPDTILLNGTIGIASSQIDDNEQVLTVKFPRSEVEEIVEPSTATLTVSGKLFNGVVLFTADDTIKVISKGKNK